MFQREVIGNVGGKPAYGNAVGVVALFLGLASFGERLTCVLGTNDVAAPIGC